MTKKSLLAVLVVAGMILSSGVAKADLSVVKSKFDVTFYGYIKAESIYQSSLANSLNALVFSYPALEPYKSEDTLSFTVRQTRFGFNITAPGPSEKAKVLGNIEMDFYGAINTDNKYAPLLRRATVTLKYPKWSLLAGQEWVLISPLYPHVSNYTAGAGLGNLGHREAQMRFTYGDVYRFAMSAGEKTEGDYNAVEPHAGSYSAVPDLEAQLGYWGKNNLQVILSGHYGEEKWLNKEATTKHNFYHDKTFESWSTNFSLNLPIGKKLALDGEFFYGANLDGPTYTGGISGEGVGFRKAEFVGGKYVGKNPVPVRDIGGWVELMVKPVNKLTIYVGYGEDNPQDEDIEGGIYPDVIHDKLKLPADVAAMSKNQMYYGHIMYDITDAFKVSLEEMQVRTEYLKQYDRPGNDGVLWRTDLAFWFFF